MKTPRLITIAACSITLACSVRASIVELPVTPANTNTYRYKFSVSTDHAKDAVSFHITIAARESDISTNCSASLEIIAREKTATSLMIRREPVAAKSFALRKNSRVWNADFTLDPRAPDYADICFVFVVPAEVIANGKTILMPGLELFEVRLQDFVPAR